MYKVTSWIKKTDYLSQKINLTHKGAHSFQNWFGGLLTIMISIMSVSSLIYFSMEVFEKKSPKTSLTTKYVSQAPNMTLGYNKGSLFFFVESMHHPTQTSLSSKFIKVSGALIYNHNNTVVYKYGFERCKYENFLNISETLFSNSETWGSDKRNFFCIDHLINSKNEKVYKNSSEYVEPFILNGKDTLLHTYTVFRVYIDKCVNTTENGNSCATPEELDKFVYPNQNKLFFVDNYVDVGNYSEPVMSFINQVSAVTFPNVMSMIQTNFKSVELFTQDGFFFEDINLIMNKKLSDSAVQMMTNTKGAISTIIFITTNMIDTYSRSYMRLQEVAANTGGIIKLLMLIGQVLNFLCWKFEEKLVFYQEIFSDRIDFGVASESSSDKDRNQSVGLVSGVSALTVGRNLPENFNPNVQPVVNKNLKCYINQGNITTPTQNRMFIHKSVIKTDIPIPVRTKTNSDRIEDNYFRYLLDSCCNKKKYNNTQIHLNLTEKVKNKIFNVKNLIDHYMETDIIKRVLFDPKKLETFEKIKISVNEVLEGVNEKEYDNLKDAKESCTNIDEYIGQRLNTISRKDLKQ